MRRGKGWRKNAKSKNGKDNAKPSKDSTKTGACKSLDAHVFDYGPKNAADQMATTWEQIVIHVGTNMGEDISNELRNRKRESFPSLRYHLMWLLDMKQKCSGRHASWKEPGLET